MRVATRSAVLAFVLSGFLALPARADDTAVAELCRYVEGRAMTLIQAGDIDAAGAFKPQLAECIRAERRSVARDARRIVAAYDRAVASASKKAAVTPR